MAKTQKQLQNAQKAHKRDVATRTLVGARLPREVAETVKKAAYMQGVSVYRFVANAIETAIQQSGVRTAVRLTPEELQNQKSLFGPPPT